MSPGPQPFVPEIDAALRRGLEEGVFPGAAAAVSLRGELVHLSAGGFAQLVPDRVALGPDTLFDLASLTKVLATTSAVAVLAGRGALRLDDPVVRYWPAFARRGKKAVTVRHLLAHNSGLPAWRKFFLELAADPGAGALFRRPRPEPGRLRSACRRGRAMAFEILEESALERPVGAEAVYSDLGFVALGHLVELVASERLDRFVEREVSGPLRLPGLRYRPLDEPPAPRGLIASTGVHRWREPAPGQEHLVPAPPPEAPPDPRPGEVDDDNAYAMGGVAGHAGLFGTAREVAGFGGAVLEELAGARRLAPVEIWRELARRDGTPGSTRALGFDTPSAQGSSAGRHIAASRAIGHLGFTGTSLWIDLDRRLAIALLSNRVHPTRANEKIRAFRPLFHDAVVEALGLAAPRGAA